MRGWRLDVGVARGWGGVVGWLEVLLFFSVRRQNCYKFNSIAIGQGT